MVFKTKHIAMSFALCIGMIINARCCAMQQTYTLANVINNAGAGAGQKILSYLPQLKDQSAVHAAGRDFRYVWDHKRPLIITHEDIINNKLPVFIRLLNAMKARNPIALDLAYGQLETLPAEIISLAQTVEGTDLLKQVRILNLCANSLPASEIAKICTWCPQLQELNLSCNKLETLPQEIKLLTNLQVLNLGGNRFVPAEIAKICTWRPLLQELYLYYNDLTALPEEIKLLTQLRVLDVSDNYLAPTEITKICIGCPQLQDLDLSSNDLQTLPEEIKQLTHLRDLDLDDNNFSLEKEEHIRQLVEQSAPNARVDF